MRPLPTLLLLIVVCLNGAFAEDFEKFEFEVPSGDKLRYARMTPLKVGAGKKYPLVISLHGVGGRGARNWEGNCYANQVLSKPEMREKYPCFVVAPNTEKGEVWWSTKGLSGKERLCDVFKLIEHLLGELPVEKDRIYITGQSMGGYGTFGAIALRPDLFAAAVPVCGGHEPESAKSFAHIPIWVFHGANDNTVPTQRSREMVEALKKAGGEPKYTEFPNVGHNAWTPAYNDEELWKWMFGRVREKG